MFKLRLLSGIVLVILSIGLFLAGGYWLLFSTLCIALMGMYELYRVFGVEKSLAAIVSYIAIIVFYCNMGWHFIPNRDNLMLIMAYIILLMFIFVFSYPKYTANQMMGTFFGIFYVGIMLSYLYLIRNLQNGLYLSFLVLICSWGCDTSAYCFGKLFGKHKMSPILSPKKSVEGAIGGMLGAAVLAAVYSCLMRFTMTIPTETIVYVSIISAIAALVSMVGDLTASAIKRNYDIKDYGKIIPGHGGIMDRFDSVIITAPIIYYLAYFFM